MPCDWNSDPKSRVARRPSAQDDQAGQRRWLQSPQEPHGAALPTRPHWRPLHVVWMSSAATRPMSAVATIGTGLSRGCRKLRNTPFLAAGATSQLKFSMNHPGRKKQIEIDNSPSIGCKSSGSARVHRRERLSRRVSASSPAAPFASKAIRATVATLRGGPWRGAIDWRGAGSAVDHSGDVQDFVPGPGLDALRAAGGPHAVENSCQTQSGKRGCIQVAPSR
jgi:hypothetical protein